MVSPLGLFPFSLSDLQVVTLRTAYGNVSGAHQASLTVW